MTQRPASDRRALLARKGLAALPLVTLLGCAGLVATALLGFEEPDGRMLLVSSLLAAAAPVGLALHLLFSRDMSRADKRAWLAGLLSSGPVELMGDYFDPEARARATLRLRAKRRERAGLAAQPPGGADASGAGQGQRATGQ